MLVSTRTWPVWVCLAAGLLSLAPGLRSEAAKPDESESLSDLVMLTRQARMNGIVLTPDESCLYVAHVEGISAIDVRTGKRTQLPVPIDAAE